MGMCRVSRPLVLFLPVRKTWPSLSLRTPHVHTPEAPLLGCGQKARGKPFPAACRLCPRAFPQENIPSELKASWPYKAACGHLSQALTAPPPPDPWEPV